MRPVPPQPPNSAPPARKPADAIIAQQNLTLYQALKQTGWVQGYDYVVVFLIVMVWVTLLFWRIFSNPTAVDALVCCMISVSLAQAWLVSLVYRCMHFVLMVRADVNMMPTAAAKIVMAGLSGGQKGGQ